MAKQAVIHPNPQQAYEQQLAEYLLQAGWEQSAELDRWGRPKWEDAARVHQAVRDVPVELPAKGGEGATEVIFQKQGPPLCWPMCIEEAAAMQRERDKAAEPLESVIARKEAELRALKEKLVEEQQKGVKR